MDKLPFNRAYMTGRELDYVQQALELRHLSGDGPFTKKCHAWLKKQTGAQHALLTHSGTAALEMSALLANIQPGDEVIMPSFTFVSTANAFALRGATPVFIDIRPDTLNLDETQIEAALTSKTRAVVPIHYAGVACEMDAIMAIARANQIDVIEDNAHGITSTYKGRPLGTFGRMAALSFHETKNLVSGEGGALLINDPDLAGRAEIIREKGTNRSSFYRGEVDKYTWIEIGSSFLPSDIIAAVLYAQFESAESIQARRMELWNYYHHELAYLEKQEKLRRPIIPVECGHNAHIYYILLPTADRRDELIHILKDHGVSTTFHYVPLHDAPAGQKFGRVATSMKFTDNLSHRLLRLPMWVDQKQAARVLEEIHRFFEG